MSVSKEMTELAELKTNLATNITLLSHHKAMLLRLVDDALRASAVAEPVAEPVAKTDAEHFGDILKTEAARLRAMADRFDPAPAAPVPASVREALENSQSLLAMINHLGSDRPTGIISFDWDNEGLSKLTAEQIAENCVALAALKATP